MPSLRDNRHTSILTRREYHLARYRFISQLPYLEGELVMRTKIVTTVISIATMASTSFTFQ